MKGQTQAKGFTLLELLIVIAIIVTLGVILIFVLNPAETLAKSRDAQRISDLSTLKTALSVYTTTVTSPVLDDDAAFDCLEGTPQVDATIGYSATGTEPIACVADVAEGAEVTAGSTFDSAGGDFCQYSATPTATDNSGWIPVNFGAITGGSPISSLPVDPINTVAVNTAPASTDLVYRYACQSSTDDGTPENVFEIDTVLESQAYTVDDNRMTADGGDNANYYETGTSVQLLGGGTNF